MTDRRPGHGLDDLLGMLNELDGKRVTVKVQGTARPSFTGGTVVGPTRKDIEDIAAEVTQRILDYQGRRR